MKTHRSFILKIGSLLIVIVLFTFPHQTIGSPPLNQKVATQATTIIPLSSAASFSIEFNSSHTTNLYQTSSSFYKRYQALAFYINVTSNLDVMLEIHDNSINGTILGSSNTGGPGNSETFVVQPYQFQDLVNGQLLVNVSKVAGDGNATFVFEPSASNDFLDQSSASSVTLDIDPVSLMVLNYSSGAQVDITLDNRDYTSDFSYDVYIFTSNGNLLQSVFSSTVTVDALVGDLYKISLHQPMKVDHDGLVLLVLGNIMRQYQFANIQSNVFLPQIEGISIMKIDPGVTSLDFGLTETKYLGFEVSSTAVVAEVKTSKRTVDYQLSSQLVFNSTYLITSERLGVNSSYMSAIQDYGHSPSDHAIGFSWYFLKISDLSGPETGLHTIKISIKLLNSVTTISQDSSFSYSLSEGDFKVMLLELSPLPSDTIFWMESIDIDGSIYLFDHTQNASTALKSDMYGIGGTESLGSVYTADQLLYIVVVKSINGSGNLDLHINRASDLDNPVVNYFNYTKMIPVGSVFRVDMGSSDNLGVLNQTIFIKQRDVTTDFKSLGSTDSEYQLNYGEYEFFVVVYDVAFNKIKYDNASHNFFLSVYDDTAPTLISFSANFEPNTATNITLEVADAYSGVGQVIVEYSVDGIAENITASGIGTDNYTVTIPEIGANKTVTLVIYIQDLEGNWFKSKNYEYFIGINYIDIDMDVPPKVYVGENFKIAVDVSKNIPIKEVRLHLIPVNSTILLTYYNFTDSTSYEFSLNLGSLELFTVWVEIIAINSARFFSTNLTLQVQKRPDVISSTPSSSSSKISSSISSSLTSSTSTKSTGKEVNPDSPSPILIGSIIGLFALSSITLYTMRNPDSAIRKRISNFIKRIKGESS